MTHSHNSMKTALFLVAGITSGALSGASVLFKPWGLIAPGALFGFALVTAELLSTRRQIGFWPWILFPAFSTGINFTAGLLSLFLGRFFDGYRWHGQFIIGLTCGSFGAFLLSTAWTYLLRVDNPWRCRLLGSLL